MHRLVVLITAGVVGVVLTQASPAFAYDSYPCGGQFGLGGGDLRVQYCPDWSPNNWIPVHQGASPSSSTAGHIYAPGSDWYVCQWRNPNSIYALGAYQTDVWAYTMADNGAWGWVPEVYFRGGQNFEPDRTLRWC